jgi:hypothetical protein
MAEQTLTFEEIDGHINALDLAPFRAGGPRQVTAALAQADPKETISRVCAIYRGVRPILAGLAAIPFIPGKWKEALKVFMSLMDALCPGS